MRDADTLAKVVLDIEMLPVVHLNRKARMQPIHWIASFC